MSPAAKVDVLLCTSNQDGSSLDRTLQSLRDSTLREIRIILVNDSGEPLKGRWKEFGLPIQVLDLGRRNGLSLALKEAERHITAEYAARMDCGDEMHPDRLRLQAAYLDGNPDCVLVGAASRLFLKKDGRLVDCGITRSSSGIRSMRALVRRTNPFVHGSIMMRASRFAEIGGYDGACRVAQDYNLLLRMMRVGRLAILDGPLYTHYFNARSSTTVKKNKDSIMSGLKSRFRHLPMRDLLTPEFAGSLLRDLLLLALPAGLVVFLRFGTLKWRLGSGHAEGH